MTEAINVELAGPVSRIVLPDLCVYCGASPAQQRILMKKAFKHWYRTDGTFKRWEFTQVRVPFCATCAEKHRSQEVRLSSAARLLLLFQTWSAIPMLICAALAVRFAQLTVASPQGWLLPFAAAAVLTLFCAGLAVTGWRNTRERAIPKPTEVSASFDFSEDRSLPLEPEHRAFALRNPRFAAAFAEANRDRLWNPQGAHVRVARSFRRVLWILFVGTSLLILVWKYFLPLR